MPHLISHNLISQHHNSAIQTYARHRHRSRTTDGPEAIITHLTVPKAIMATPLPKPETPTGVLRWIVLPSPTCTNKILRQPQIRLTPQQTTAPSKRQQQASLGPRSYIPSTTPRRRPTAHTNDPAKQQRHKLILISYSQCRISYHTTSYHNKHHNSAIQTYARHRHRSRTTNGPEVIITHLTSST